MTLKDWIDVCVKCWEFFPNGLDENDHCEGCAFCIKEDEELEEAEN